MSSSTEPSLSSPAQPSQPTPQPSQETPLIVSPSPAELALLDASCRILTVSTSLQRATTFIEHIQAIAKPSSLPNTLTTANVETQPSATNSSTPSTAGMPLLTPSLVKIPWTISNRYYTADVHFAAHTIHALSPHVVRNVPAVVFVWEEGEAYKHHIQRLKSDLEGYDPDVMLAVRYKRMPGEPQNDGQDDEHAFEDNGDIDAFLAEHGFEYVDASKEHSSSRREAKNDEGPSPIDHDLDEEDEDDIPRLPRVLDALGTIMWPSMRSTPRAGRTSVSLDTIASLSQNAVGGGNTKPRINDAHLDWAHLSQDPIMAALDEITGEALRPNLNPESRSSTDDSPWLPSTKGSASSGFNRMSSGPSWKSSTKLRTNKLGVRLDTGGLTFGEGDDPWRFAAADTGKVVVMSPVDTLDVEAAFPKTGARGDIFPAPAQPKHEAMAAELGFDDDFTVFVSAPATEYNNQESHDDDSDDEYRDRMGRLVPPHSGENYRSLGSVSDFGDSDRGRGDEELSERINNPEKGELSKIVDVASGENDTELNSDATALQASKVDSKGSKGVLSQSDADKLEYDSDLDAYMPSQNEIQEVAARLFGGGTGATTAIGSQIPPKADLDSESDTDADYDMAPFDLPAVVGALQQMKAEIAGMTDEDERRRAAARVALGLVYGLEAER